MLCEEIRLIPGKALACAAIRPFDVCQADEVAHHDMTPSSYITVSLSLVCFEQSNLGGVKPLRAALFLILYVVLPVLF